jgi:hypothetical protein
MGSEMRFSRLSQRPLALSSTRLTPAKLRQASEVQTTDWLSRPHLELPEITPRHMKIAEA